MALSCCCCTTPLHNKAEVTCSHCKAIHQPETISIMKSLHSIKPKFQVWERSCHHGYIVRNIDIPQQPASIWNSSNGNQLLLGDISEWFYPSCEDSNVKTIINLCPDKTDSCHLHRACELGAIVVSIPADDNWCYDIIEDVCTDTFMDFICHRLKVGSVLISCYAGCNRSAAVAMAILVLRFKVDIIRAFDLISKRRGKILTNYHFRLLLVKAALTFQKNSD